MLSGTDGQEATSSGLNGAQVSALTTLLTAGGRGDLPPDTLKAALIASFPSINQELAEQMVAPLREAAAEKQAANSPPDWNALLGSGTGEPPPETPEPTEEPPPDEGASEIPEPTEPSPPEMSHPEFKKNCTKGYACGLTCISKTRKCHKQAGEDKKPAIDSLIGVTATSKSKKKGKTATSKPKETAPVAESDKQDTPAPTDNPSTYKPPINDAELARRRELLVEVAGEETVAAFEKNVQSIIDNAELMIRVPSVDVLEKIIDDRFKSQFETHSSGGALAPGSRAHTEKLMFGYDSDLSPEQRPIYGYLGDKSDRDDGLVSSYGDISVRLKPEVRGRATLTGNDSLVLSPSETDCFPPSRLDKVNAGSFFKEATIKRRNGQEVTKKMQRGAQASEVYDFLGKYGSAYVEAQIHGQVKPSDIKEIVFFMGERPSPKILQWAKQNNVKIVIEEPSPPEMSHPEFKKKNCTKGYACGLTCISKTRKCRKQATEDKKPAIDSLSGVTATSKPKKTAPSAAKSKGETAPVADTSDKPTDKPDTLKPPINDAELARRRELLVQVAGEKRVAAFEKTVQRIVDNAELMIRVPSVDVLEKIIDDRFKSQFETKTSMGSLAPVDRAHTEKLMFGYDSDLSPEQRPIYGYLGDKRDLDDEFVSAYGDISVRLKPEVRGRATLTGNDSLVLSWETDFFPPSRLDKVNAGSFFKEATINRKNGQEVKEDMQLGARALDVGGLIRRVFSSYVEAQIHGQVKPSDIKEIAFLRGERPSPKILQWAKQNNVNIVVED